MVMTNMTPIVIVAIFVSSASVTVKSVSLAKTELANGEIIFTVIIQDTDIIPALEVNIVADETTPALVILKTGACDFTGETSASSVIAVFVNLTLPVLNALFPLALFGTFVADKVCSAVVIVNITPVTNVNGGSALLTEPADFVLTAGFVVVVTV